MAWGGALFDLPALVPLTRTTGLWPTPKASPSGPDYARISRPRSGGDDLATRVARTTPGPLNPQWVDWLMGYPPGWTAPHIGAAAIKPGTQETST